MAVTDTNAVSAQIQKYWAPLFMKELRESLLLGALVNRDYQGDIKAGGDTVKVSQINAPTGSLLDVGTNSGSFDTEELGTTQVEVTANKRAVAAFEFEDLAILQSQLDNQDSELRISLLHSVGKQINNYLYSLVAPSTSAPDHSISGVTDFNAAQLAAVRLLGAKARWPKDSKGWWLLADPSYYSDLLNASTLTSSDYGAVDAPVISGQMARQRFGFNILEDNSDGILTISPTANNSADCALAFHPDFMYLVMQREPTIEVSKLHASKKFGYVMSADVVFGAKLGINGNVKHVEIYNS